MHLDPGADAAGDEKGVHGRLVIKLVFRHNPQIAGGHNRLERIPHRKGVKLRTHATCCSKDAGGAGPVDDLGL